MWTQSSSRIQRGKRLRPEHYLQLFLLVAVSIWLLYQLEQCYSKRGAVAVEMRGSRGVDGELTRRHQLGRKGLDEFAGGSSDEDAPGVSGGSTIARNSVEWEQKSSKDGEDEEDDGLFGYDDGDEGDFHDFHLQNGEGEENNALDRSAVLPINTSVRAQEDAAADGTDKALRVTDLSTVNTSSIIKNSSLFLNDSH